MKRILAVLASVVVLAASGASAVNAQPAKHQGFKLPDGAVQLADGSYYLGARRDPSTGKLVEGIAFLHPKKETVKGSAASVKGGTTCYAFLARGLKWKTAEPWVVDQTNTGGLGNDYLLSHTAANIGKWESAAAADFFGNGTLGNGLSADTVTPDGNNEVLFGSIAESGVIAVTIVWGYYSGPTQNRAILEWDQVFDDQDYAWSATGEAGKMDFDNISTHELGHAAGLGHPGNTCTEETMYAYAGFGETKKRDLNTGDIAGIRALY